MENHEGTRQEKRAAETLEEFRLSLCARTSTLFGPKDNVFFHQSFGKALQKIKKCEHNGNWGYVGQWRRITPDCASRKLHSAPNGGLCLPRSLDFQRQVDLSRQLPSQTQLSANVLIAKMNKFSSLSDSDKKV